MVIKMPDIFPFAFTIYFIFDNIFFLLKANTLLLLCLQLLLDQVSLVTVWGSPSIEQHLKKWNFGENPAPLEKGK